MSKDLFCTWLVCRDERKVKLVVEVLKPRFPELMFEPSDNGQSHMIKVLGPKKNIDLLKTVCNSVISAT